MLYLHNSANGALTGIKFFAGGYCLVDVIQRSISK